MTGKSCDKSVIASGFLVDFIKGLISCLLLCIAGLVIRDSREVLWFAASIPVAIGSMSAFTHVWEREESHGILVTQAAVGGIIGLGSTALLLLMDAGWHALPIGIAMGLFSESLLSHIRAKKLPLKEADYTSMRAIFKKSLPYVGVSISTYFSSLGVDAALAVFGAVLWVAPYRVAVSLLQTVLGTLAGVIVRASFAADAHRNRSGDTMVGLAASFTSIAVIVVSTVFLAVLCFFLMPELALQVYGKQWQSAASLVPILTISVGLRTMASPLGMVLLSSRYASAEARIKGVEAFVGALLVGSLASYSIYVALGASAVVALIAMVLRLAVLNYWKADSAVSITYLVVISLILASLATGFLLWLDLASGSWLYYGATILSALLVLLFAASAAFWLYRSERSRNTA